MFVSNTILSKDKSGSLGGDALSRGKGKQFLDTSIISPLRRTALRCLVPEHTSYFQRAPNNKRRLAESRLLRKEASKRPQSTGGTPRKSHRRHW